MKTLILTIITGSLILFIIACGYTELNKSSTSSEYTNPQQDFNHLLSGLWTMRRGTTRAGDAKYVDYYLLFHSDGRYGISMFDQFPNLTGNYIIESDTLSFVTEYFISIYQFSLEGQLLILRFINLEQLNEKYMLPNLEGRWRPG